jgi:hypothetical protein
VWGKAVAGSRYHLSPHPSNVVGVGLLPRRCIQASDNLNRDPTLMRGVSEYRCRLDQISDCFRCLRIPTVARKLARFGQDLSGLEFGTAIRCRTQKALSTFWQHALASNTVDEGPYFDSLRTSIVGACEHFFIDSSPFVKPHGIIGRYSDHMRYGPYRRHGYQFRPGARVRVSQVGHFCSCRVVRAECVFAADRCRATPRDTDPWPANATYRACGRRCPPWVLGLARVPRYRTAQRARPFARTDREALLE